MKINETMVGSFPRLLQNAKNRLVRSRSNDLIAVVSNNRRGYVKFLSDGGATGGDEMTGKVPDNGPCDKSLCEESSDTSSQTSYTEDTQPLNTFSRKLSIDFGKLVVAVPESNNLEGRTSSCTDTVDFLHGVTNDDLALDEAKAASSQTYKEYEEDIAPDRTDHKNYNAGPGNNEDYYSDMSSLSEGSIGSSDPSKERYERMEYPLQESSSRMGRIPRKTPIATEKSAITRMDEATNESVALMWSFNCTILLMDPKRKIFAFVVADYQPDVSDDVQDVISKIPLVAKSDYLLRFQKYIGLIHQGKDVLTPGNRMPMSTFDERRCYPPRPQVVSVCVGQPQRQSAIDDDNNNNKNPLLSLKSPLVAIPDGYTFQEIQNYSQMILEDPKVVRSLVDMQYLMLLE